MQLIISLAVRGKGFWLPAPNSSYLNETSENTTSPENRKSDKMLNNLPFLFVYQKHLNIKQYGQLIKDGKDNKNP